MGFEMHPLLTLLATRPQLLADHAQAYAGLFHEEFGQSFATWRRWAMLQAVALCFLGVAAVLGGVAVMLWAVTPPLLIQAPLVLWVMPLLPLLGAILCIWTASRQSPTDAFGNLGRQLGADMAMLRTAELP
jgi:uncharacterized membrane protein YqjE